MKTYAVVGLAALAACGGSARSMKSAVAPSGAAPSPVMAAPASEAATADVAAAPDAAAPAKIASSAQVAAAELTAGVWDDNLNFEFFRGYAARTSRLAPDLAAFTPAEQAAAHQLHGQLAQRTQLDIQLLIDTTGSMGDEMRYLKAELGVIASQVKARFPNVTPRWSLVVYKDRGDEYVVKPFEFTTDLAKFQRDLAVQSAGGGGDFPEAVIAGFDHALQQRWRSDDSVAKLVFWVADAPPHPGEGHKFAALVRRARDLGVHVYPIASSGIDDGTEYQMRAAAQLTGGRYIFLTDDSGIGNSHAEPHIPCYAVTYLKDAMIRVIGSELSGRRMTVDPERVVRTVGAPNAEGACSVGEQQVVAF